MITLVIDNKPVEVKWIEFSDGAITCKVDSSIEGQSFSYISFSVDPSTPCKQVGEELTLLRDALECLGVKSDQIYLYLPYLPYARADRVFEKGNPNPLSRFLINVNFFDRIYLFDVHNLEALEEWLDKGWVGIIHKPQLQCFRESFSREHKKDWDYVISPDKGAKEKAESIADFLGVPCVEASKKRDISTGRIIDTTLDTELPVGSSVIICDDILDGGGTFIPLAEKLRSQGCTVDLYITHLIAAKGLDLFKGLIDNIYCWHTVGKYITKQDVMNFNLGK